MSKILVAAAVLWFGAFTYLGLRYDRFPEVLIGATELFVAGLLVAVLARVLLRTLKRRN